MSRISSTSRRTLAPAVLGAITLCVSITLPATGEAGPMSGAVTDSLAPGQLIQPEELARLLPDTTARRPALWHVGFKVLFRSGHIPGSRYIGPGSKPEGLTALKQALRKMPRQQAVVLYCGCCPWNDCPNVLPAFRVARGMGFKDVRVLYIAKNLQRDWIDKGLPIRESDQQ